MSKILNTRPRGKRSSTPGDMLTLEGTITKVEDGRFVQLDQTVVR
jgi:hypothetical protein